jgi:hypothetical protein
MALGALAALALAGARADIALPVPTAPGSEVTIKLSTPAAFLPRFGFEPVRVSIENTAAQERSWRVGFQVGMGNQYPGLATTERTITVPAGQTRDTWIFVPLAEPSVNAARVTPAGSPVTSSGLSGGPPPRVTITKTVTGTKVTVVRMLGSGSTVMTQETEINATTGERKSTTTSGSGTGSNFSSTNSNTPPSNMTVTYVINPVTGEISSNYSSSRPTGIAGVLPTSPRVSIVTSTNPAAGAPPTSSARSSSSPSNTKVTIADTPIGTKVTRVTQVGSRILMTMEQEIDATTGAMTTTTTMPSGNGPPPRTSSPTSPGTEMTFTIDPNTGTISTSSRSGRDPTAAPKITIVKSAAPGAAASTISTTGPVMPPFATMTNFVGTSIYADVSGPGVTAGRMTLPDSSRGTTMRPFAVSATLDQAVRGKLAAIVRGAPNLSAIEAAQLPADWRVWSPFAAVIIPSDEFAGLDAGRRGALRGWVALGGRLWLSPSATGEEHAEKFGAGVITTLAEPVTASGPPPAVSPVTTAPVANGAQLASMVAEIERRRAASGRPGGGLGGAMIGGAMIPTSSVDQAAIDLWVKKIQIYDGTPGLPERVELSLEKSAIGASVQDPPAAGTQLAILLVAFAIIIGPVNLFVFAPASKRHRLFLTTPLIAFAATLVLGLMILLQDGLGGDGLRRALVVLLPGDNEAAVFQEQATRTGFLTSRAFALADDTQMTALPLDELDARIGYTPANAELVRADGRASGDWFRNRSRQAQLLQRLVPTRGRVERVGTAPGGVPIVQSSLATPLRSFVFADEAGTLWTVPELPPGKRVTLTRGGTALAASSLSGSHRFAQVLRAVGPSEPGHWSASGGATDLAPIATLASVRWAEADVLFTGMLEGAAAVEKEAKP